MIGIFVDSSVIVSLCFLGWRHLNFRVFRKLYFLVCLLASAFLRVRKFPGFSERQKNSQLLLQHSIEAKAAKVEAQKNKSWLGNAGCLTSWHTGVLHVDVITKIHQSSRSNLLNCNYYTWVTYFQMWNNKWMEETKQWCLGQYTSLIIDCKR